MFHIKQQTGSATIETDIEVTLKIDVFFFGVHAIDWM